MSNLSPAATKRFFLVIAADALLLAGFVAGLLLDWGVMSRVAAAISARGRRKTALKLELPGAGNTVAAE